MHKLIEAIVIAVERETRTAVDRNVARLGLLTVIHHLPRALEADELDELARSLPLQLALLIRRPVWRSPRRG